MNGRRLLAYVVIAALLFALAPMTALAAAAVVFSGGTDTFTVNGITLQGEIEGSPAEENDPVTVNFTVNSGTATKSGIATLDLGGTGVASASGPQTFVMNQGDSAMSGAVSFMFPMTGSAINDLVLTSTFTQAVEVDFGTDRGTGGGITATGTIETATAYTSGEKLFDSGDVVEITIDVSGISTAAGIFKVSVTSATDSTLDKTVVYALADGVEFEDEFTTSLTVASTDVKDIVVDVEYIATPLLLMNPAVTFQNVALGYAQPAAKAITVDNSLSTEAASNVVLTLDGADAGDFTLASPQVQVGINAGEDDGGANWTIQPNAGLAAGTYTVDVIADCDEYQTAGVTDGILLGTVTFTVNPLPYSGGSYGSSATTSSPTMTAASATYPGYGALLLRSTGLFANFDPNNSLYADGVKMIVGEDYELINNGGYAWFNVSEDFMKSLSGDVVFKATFKGSSSASTTVTVGGSYVPADLTAGAPKTGGAVSVIGFVLVIMACALVVCVRRQNAK